MLAGKKIGKIVPIFLGLLVCLMGAIGSGPVLAQYSFHDRPGALLRGLDKTTARVQSFELPIGTPYRFGSLEITVRACRATPPEETPEAAAFLEIVEVKDEGQRGEIFKGWMFQSSPAISAMEHPVYDVWLLACLGGAEEQATPEPEPAPQ